MKTQKNAVESTETVDDKKRIDEFNKKLSDAISFTIDAEAAFKLYSYRCISPEQFVARFEAIKKGYE